MILTLIGHSGYVGRNIKDSLVYFKNFNIYLVDRNTPEIDFLNYLKLSDIVINCAGIQKPCDNTIESFHPNFDLTKKIVDNLNINTKLIFVSSIHYNSNTPFGIVRKKEENYIISNVKFYTIYHLPHTFGRFGKANYNNVFNTFIINLIGGNEIQFKEFNHKYSLISISKFVKFLCANLENDLFVVDKFNSIKITLPEFFFVLLKVHFGEEEKSVLYEDLKFVYNYYKS